MSWLRIWNFAKKKPRTMNILELPDEILTSIFFLLIDRLTDLSNLDKTCKTFRRIIRTYKFQIGSVIGKAEDLKKVDLEPFAWDADADADENKKERDLSLYFADPGEIKRSRNKSKSWWHQKMARNLERGMPSLHTLKIFNCGFDASVIDTVCFPKSAKRIEFNKCRFDEKLSRFCIAYGLPYQTVKCQMFELLLSHWDSLPWEEITFRHCRDQYALPYAITFWMYLHYDLQDNGSPWETVQQQQRTVKRRTIRGIEIMTYNDDRFCWLDKKNFTIVRDISGRKVQISYEED